MSEFQKGKYRFSPVSPLVVVGADVIEERREEIITLRDELILYSVVLKDLTYLEVPYDIRNELLNIALYIISDVELYENFTEKKELPIEGICKRVAKPRKYIEQYKEYIITYIIILGNPGYKLIQDYLKVIEENKKLDDSSITVFSEDNSTRGIVFAKSKKSAMIMNSVGEFKNIKIIEELTVGEETEGYKRKSLKDYKMQVSILVMLIIITSGLGVYRYNKVVTTVVVDISSSIKLDINSLGKAVKVYSDKGSNSEISIKDDILDRDLDTALYKIIKYYNDNDMLSSGKVIVTISGKSIEYGVLKETQEYVKEKSVEVKINNNGVEQKLY